MPVLILTMGGDSHAAPVAHVLRMLGEPSTLHVKSSEIGAGGLSFYVGDTIEASVNGASAAPGGDQTVWNRRNPIDLLRPDNVHPADVRFLSESISYCLDAVRVHLDRCFSVNPVAASRLLSNKVNQLIAAKESGLAVPRTLISSDPARVRAFVKSANVTCVKSLIPVVWFDKEKIRASFTSILEESRLKDDEICLAPAIYQEFINKIFDVRVTVFGNYMVSTRIDLFDGRAAIDWRVDLSYLRRLSTLELPQVVRNSIKKLMSLLGIRFGSFDFVVDKEGAWTFIEVNEAGQFLWQEEFCPEVVLLEPFARFLVQRSDDFTWDPAAADPAFRLERVDRELATSADLTALLRKEAGPASAFGGIDECQHA